VSAGGQGGDHSLAMDGAIMQVCVSLFIYLYKSSRVFDVCGCQYFFLVLDTYALAFLIIYKYLYYSNVRRLYAHNDKNIYIKFKN
jgi:hypothetical protein